MLKLVGKSEKSELVEYLDFKKLPDAGNLFLHTKTSYLRQVTLFAIQKKKYLKQVITAFVVNVGYYILETRTNA